MLISVAGRGVTARAAQCAVSRGQVANINSNTTPENSRIISHEMFISALLTCPRGAAAGGTGCGAPAAPTRTPAPSPACR